MEARMHFDSDIYV